MSKAKIMALVGTAVVVLVVLAVVYRSTTLKGWIGIA